MNLNIDKWLNSLRQRKAEILKFLNDNGYHTDKNFETKNKELVFNLRKTSLSKLRVACIMDRFTLESYAPECDLSELTPEGWKDEIDSFMPDLVFIESAWEGKDKLWYRKVSHCSKEYFEMTKYCQEKNIPIVFWNKEDPVYTETFMAAARMADFVFTTDIDCIQKYRTQLGHDRVYHLHFAAQPKIHNPIEKYKRKDKFCFAGAYYHRYKQRAAVFDSFAEEFIETKGFDIYDRNYQNALPEHAFPKEYNSYILGRLDPSDIDIAYKGYTYGINMNSIHQSQTMFARRVFELLASNTITVGNYSRGVKNYFGDLTISTDDRLTLRKHLQLYSSDSATMRKYRLAGLRKVLSEHLYEDRLAYVIEKVFGVNLKPDYPLVTVISNIEDEKSFDRLIQLFNQQSYTNRKLVIVTDLDIKEIACGCTVIKTEDAKHMILSELVNDGFVSIWNIADEYGDNYLLDLVLTNRYGDFDVIGKASYYTMNNEEAVLIDKGTYYLVEELDTRRSIFKPELFKNETISSLVNGYVLKEGKLFSTDEFNYCENCSSHCIQAEDLFIPDQGIPLNRIEAIAERIPPLDLDINIQKISAQEIYSSIKDTKETKFRKALDNNQLKILSTLAQEEHFYILFEKLYNVDEFCSEDKLFVLFQGAGNLDVICTCIFYDKNKTKLSPVFTQLNRLEKFDVPKDACYFKFAIRIKGEGECRINQITLGNACYEIMGNCFLSRSDVLVLSNHYPSPDALYRNMFVHKRLTMYKESGHVFDIMRMNIYAKDGFREFEGINVVEGQAETLDTILRNEEINTICVHFLDSHMWGVLKNYLDTKRIIVWVHGAEIQPWWRRTFNYSTEAELEKAKNESVIRMNFWKEVFEAANEANIHFVFVSEYFAGEVMEDYKINLRPEQYSVIHNCIDTKMFNYIPKTPDQRTKILSIKPYTSAKYANDLTAKAIYELSKNDNFDKFEFYVFGEGEFFDNDNAIIKRFKNVHLNKKFLTQDEIAELHKECGVFIATTRWDSQGVSRDEAMSSGLVCIANSVAAIPEFIDESCGMLVPGEDYKGIADSLLNLYYNPDLFIKLSESAAKRVRSQSAKEFTIDKEIELIREGQ